MSLEQHPIHASLNRPHTMLGVDLQLVLVTAGIAAIIPVARIGWDGLLAGAILWAASIPYMRKWCKRDPLIRKVMLRHMQYRAYYPAKCGLQARRKTAKGNWRNAV